MKEAALNELKRLDIKVDPAAAPASAADNVDPLSFIVQGYNAAVQKRARPEHEIDAWLAMPVVLDRPVMEYWDREGVRFPFLQRLARAYFVAQASGASSERVWSAADDASGGDRASAAPETLNAQLILKKNTPVKDRILNCSLFDVLKKCSIQACFKPNKAGFVLDLLETHISRLVFCATRLYTASVSEEGEGVVVVCCCCCCCCCC